MKAGARPKRRYCLVTPTQISCNPRLVKEADALTAAGHDVRVVAVAFDAARTQLDRNMASSRGWRLEHVQTAWRSPVGALRRGGWGLVERASEWAFAAHVPGGVVRDHAYSRFVRPLARRAAAEPVDVVIAHNLQALPAAARAARRRGARLGFDIEDLHTGELPDGPEHQRTLARITALERHYLPRCDYLTAAAPGIADAIVDLYGVRRPVVVLNTFPAEERAASPAPDRRHPGGDPALYWFSQTLGPDRGIEDAVEALGRMSVPAHLYLRGAAPPEYRARVLDRAAELGCGERVHFLSLVPPGELVARSSEHDVGLALEQPITRNRDLCVTNKLFTYMLAGLAVAATDTAGQRAILAGRDVGAFLYRAGDAASLAAQLDALLSSPERLARARRKALAAALDEFSWARDAERLVAYLESDPAPVAIAEGAALLSRAPA